MNPEPASAVELSIRRLSKQGEGVAEHAGRTVFVEGALPGEKVRARIDSSGKVLRGELLEVLEPSPSRRAPGCALADRCGGCDWLQLSEEAQRAAREEIVLSALEHLGQLRREDVRLLPTIASAQAMAYRRRAVLHVSKEALGFFGRRSHDFVPIEACPALTPALGELPAKVSEALGAVKADAQEIHLLASGDKVAFAVFLKGALKPRDRELSERAVQTLKLAGAVVVPKEGSALVIGKPALRMPAPLRPEVPLYARPDGFSQANEGTNEALVRAAVEALGATPADQVLELFCGNGNFTFAVAAKAASVLGVESAGVSLELARRSVAEAKLQNVRLVQGDAKRVCEGLVAEGKRFDLLLADPPRSGAPGLSRWARQLGVRRVVYVACDPAALARDAAELRNAGFRPRTLQLVDMFPQTHHVEAVLALSLD